MKILASIGLLFVSTFAQAAGWTCVEQYECIKIRGSGYQTLHSYSASATAEQRGQAWSKAYETASAQCQAGCNDDNTVWCSHIDNGDLSMTCSSN